MSVSKTFGSDNGFRAIRIVLACVAFSTMSVIHPGSVAMPSAPVPGPVVGDSDLTSEREGDPSLEQAETRLQTIGFRLAATARSWCDKVQPGIGWAIHTAEQYDGESRRLVEAAVGFDGQPAIAAVVADGPAAGAGLRAGDRILSLGPIDLASRPGDAPTDRVNRIDGALAALPPDGPIPVQLRRTRDRVETATILPMPVCRTRFELDLSNPLQAQADGELVQIGVRWLQQMADADVAVLVAHELAHNMLHHRRRLEAAGARWGMLSGLGRNADLFRETEMEADRLAVHLLAQAGYDPGRAAVVWPAVERATGSTGLARSRTHPPARQRIAAMQDEADRLGARGDAPAPAILLQRDRPLTGNWRALLPSGQ